MRGRLPLRGGPILVLLALLPAVALAPFWLGETRLLGPGDGSALHFPLRAAVWESYRRFDLPSWNEGIFFGTPLLAAYRPGAFYPLMPLLALLEPFDAFQALVLLSLAAAAAITFLYLRRLGAHNVGAYVGALSFSLGPYLMSHISDTATLVAAPVLPLLLLAAESHMNRRTAARAAGLAAALALLLLAGSPEAVRAGLALMAGRVSLGHLLGGRDAPPVWMSLVAFAAGLLLAAPQILPSLYTASQSGLRTTGLANPPGDWLGGLAGLVLRYVSHTPAPALALAAVPLVFTQLPFRVLAVALGACLALQWGRGPLAAPGALPLVFDLTLAILAGLSMSALWRERHTSLGRRLREHFLVAAMASAVALSIAATTAGPLPQALAGAVGVLALAFIAWFLLAGNKDPVVAGVFLIPLTASFLLQPYARGTVALAPTRGELVEGTTVRQAVDGAMALRRGEPTLALVEQWPSRDDAIDLAYANYGSLSGRRGVNGYDPMVQARVRQAFDGMGSGGAVRSAFFASDPMRLAFLGVRWIEVPVWGMRHQWKTAPDLAITLGAGRRRLLFPLTPATAVDVTAQVRSSSALAPERTVAWIDVRLATGRSLRLALNAAAPQTRIAFPARYNVIGVDLFRAATDVEVVITGLGLFDQAKERATALSVPAAFLSDAAVFRDALATPSVWLYEVRHRQEPRVVAKLRRLASDEAVLETMRRLTESGVDVDDEVLARMADAPPQDPADARSSRVALVRSVGSRVDLYAQGPGYLVLPQTFEEGWRAGVDDVHTVPFRVNHFQTALALGPGMHRVALRYTPRGLVAGMILAAVTLVALLGWVRGEGWFRWRARRGDNGRVMPRALLVVAAAAVAGLTLHGCGDTSQRSVWFTPNLGTSDMIRLFEAPEEWTKARGQIDVFEFHQANVLAQTSSDCPMCGNNLFPALQRAGAIPRLRDWGIEISIGGGALKEHDCEGTVSTRLALEALRNVAAAGGETRYYTMDEPLLAGRRCGQSTEETARRTAAFVRTLRAEFPGLRVGNVEPYPIITFPELEYWLLRLRAENALPPFFHLDVDRAALVHHPEAEVKRDLRLLRDFCETLGVRFGVMLQGLDGASSDKDYYDDVMSWIGTIHDSVGMPRNTVFISWHDSGPARDIPKNLPESDENVYSHTRLVNDGLAVLRPGR